jgi:DNA-binding IscR family transcriptional regulator
MHTSTRFAVAIHILTLLAQDQRGPATSEAIAGSVKTNPVVIRRVLARLRNQGLVESQPGSGGGGGLLRAPSAITQREINRAIDAGCGL